MDVARDAARPSENVTEAKQPTAVRPIQCSKCGAPVPLPPERERAQASCRMCGALEDIPADLAAMRAAGERGRRAQLRAHELAEQLVRPPGLLLRSWSLSGALALLFFCLVVLVWLVVSIVMCFGTLLQAGLTGALAALLVSCFLGVPLMVNELLHGLAHRLGTDYADAWGGVLSNGLIGLFFYLSLAAPLLLSAFADSFETLRATLRELLAAKPTTTEGGPAECHHCGGPLELEAGALHARCVYCLADNLVALPAQLVREATKATHEAVLTLEAAEAEERAAWKTGLRKLGRDLSLWLLLIPAFILLGLGTAAVNSDTRTFFHRANASAPLVPKNSQNPVIARDVSTPFTARDSFDSCDAHTCTAHYFVALEKGEQLELIAEEGELAYLLPMERSTGPWYNPRYDWRPTDLRNGAPYRGWYRVSLMVDKRADAPTPVVRWTTRKDQR